MFWKVKENEINSIKADYEQRIQELNRNNEETVASLHNIIKTLKKQQKIDREVILSQEMEIEGLEENLKNIQRELEDTKKFFGEIVDLEQFSPEALGDKLSAQAWCGKSAKAELSINGIKVIFNGVVYDRAYEDYTAGCDVIVERQDGSVETLREEGSNCAGSYSVKPYVNGSWETVRELIKSSGDKGVLKFF